jgi:hypothetical protein
MIWATFSPDARGIIIAAVMALTAYVTVRQGFACRQNQSLGELILLREQIRVPTPCEIVTMAGAFQSLYCEMRPELLVKLGDPTQMTRLTVLSKVITLAAVLLALPAPLQVTTTYSSPQRRFSRALQTSLPITSAVISPPAPGCFADLLSGSPADRAIALSTVFLLTHSRNRKFVALGTGTIIADSGMNGGPNRIVSVIHVSEPVFPDGGIAETPGETEVYDSMARPLGRARIAEAYTVNSGDDLEKAISETAVYDMVPGSFPDAYGDIPGVPLSPFSPGRPLTGIPFSPGGFYEGYSGGGVFDPEGRLVAAGSDISSLGLGADGQTVEIPSTDMLAAVRAVSVGAEPIIWFATHNLGGGLRLLTHSRGYMSPVAVRPVLAELGHAGHAALASHGAATTLRSMRITGFPSGYCTVYKSDLEIYDRRNPLQKISLPPYEILGSGDFSRPWAVRLEHGTITEYDGQGNAAVVTAPSGVSHRIHNGREVPGIRNTWTTRAAALMGQKQPGPGIP